MSVRSIAARTLLVVGSVLLALGLIEVAIRAAALAPPVMEEYGGYVSDPHLPFMPAPGTVRSGRSLTDEYDFEATTNSVGFRDVEHALEKPDSVFRILGLGDSFTWGAGADFEETYLHQLESSLNSRVGQHPTVEIIKAGVGRFWTEPERILFERYGVRYQPDLILVGFTPNDVADTHLGMQAIVVDDSGFLLTREAGELGPTARRLYERSHLARIALKAYVDHRSAQRYNVIWQDVFREDGAHEADWRAVEAELEKIVIIADGIGAEVVVIHIPLPGPWREQHAYPAQRLADWADRHAVGFVDAMAALSASSQPLDALYWAEDGHNTPAGYRVIAEAIHRYVTSEGLVP